MLATIRVFRVIVGLIAIWQVLGLFPVLTTWLPNLDKVTGGMWVIAFLKVLVFLVFGAIYVGLGKLKNRIDKSDSGGSDGRLVIYAVVALAGLGIVLAIALPALSNRTQAVSQTESFKTAPSHSAEQSVAANYEKPPTFESEGWTQENTGSSVSGPWLAHDPPGTRYSRFADGNIYRLFPPGVRPSAAKANPFALMDSTDRPPQ